MKKVNRLRKETPVKMKTRARTRISNKSYREGIRELMKKAYVPSEAKTTLKKGGFGLGARRSVSKQHFLKAVKELEQGELVKHRAGKAEKVFKSAASWEAWDKYRAENVEKRKTEYRREDREKSDESERAEEALVDQLEKEERRKQLNKEREAKTKYRLERSVERTGRKAAVGRNSIRGNKNLLLATIRAGEGETKDATGPAGPEGGWGAPPTGPGGPEKPRMRPL
jgi:hypothetical protein